ncbi:MAG: hypothetical protein ACQEQ0_08845 [Bacteroidota bacterium]
MANTADFFVWECPKEQIDLAYRNANIRIANGEYARDSRLDKQKRTDKIVIGYIGEYGFQHWCGLKGIDIEYLGEEVGNGPDNGDFKTRNGLVIDVKTQENQYTPQLNWRCEVTDDQIHRDVSIGIYVFCKLQIRNERYTLYIVGWDYEKDFKQNAIYRKRGDVLRGRKVHYPKWDITINELKPMRSLIEEMK